MSKSRRKVGRSVLASDVVICIATAFICSLAILRLAALHAEDTVTVTVNAPAYVNETFNVTIDLDSITDFNSGQFDLSFDASVVNVTALTNGSLDGAIIPVDRWEFLDKDTIRVIIEISGISGVSGSGYLAEISFEAVRERGDRSILDISEGLLVNTEAEEIPAEWVGAEIIVGAKEEEEEEKEEPPGITACEPAEAVVSSKENFVEGIFFLPPKDLE